MKMKRIIAKNMTEAIRLIRETLGEDAVILSDKKISNGIEVIAALDYDESLYQQQTTVPVVDKPQAQANPTHTVTARQDMSAKMGRVAKKSEEAWIKDPVLENMQNELSVLRGLLQDQLAGFAWSSVQRQHPTGAMIFRRLNRLGLKPEHCRQYAESVKHLTECDNAWQSVQFHIKDALPKTQTNIIEAGGIVAMVGLSGVGKTTMIVKLAAQAAKQLGREHVAIISMDNQRIAAHDQLRVYGNLLNLPIHVASDEVALDATLAGLKNKHLILIDTPSINPRHPRLQKFAKYLKSESFVIKKHLVVAANSQALCLAEAVKKFSVMDLDAVTITKLDESSSLGAVISVLIDSQIAIGPISTGQMVPGDLMDGNREVLLEQALAISKQHGIQESEQTLALAYGAQVEQPNSE